jgi:hypothetical protein
MRLTRLGYIAVAVAFLALLGYAGHIETLGY